jgi:hypothetical protein
LHSSFDKKVVLISSNLKIDEENAAQALKIAKLEGEQKYYGSINVRQFVNELTEKTRILEEMITEKQGLEKELKSPGFGHLVGYIKPKLRRPHTAMRSRPGTISTRPGSKQNARLDAAIHLSGHGTKPHSAEDKSLASVQFLRKPSMIVSSSHQMSSSDTPEVSTPTQ